MKRITVEEVLACGPCEGYEEPRLRTLFGERESLSALEILDMDLPPVDRLWIVLRPELLDPPVLRRFFAEHGIRAIGPSRRLIVVSGPSRRPNWTEEHVQRLREMITSE